jgi:hypothetical protein
MSSDSESENDAGLDHAAIGFAWGESSPLESASLRAFRALSIRQAMRSKTRARGVSFNKCDDTGESMISQSTGTLATGDEKDERPPST